VEAERKRGKTKYFGNDDDYLLDGVEAGRVKEACDQLLLNLSKKIVEPVLFVDTLKDETRPHEKVDAGKTRVFSAAPQHLVLVERQLCAGFASFMSRNRISNECAVGIDAHSTEWDTLTLKVMRCGNKMIAGDFTNFDGSLHPQILKECVRIINEFYGDEWQVEREMLFEHLCHSWHLAEDRVYEWSHSQPSGNTLTAILNTMYHSIAVRMAYYHLEQQQGLSSMVSDTFNQNVSVIVYGDDGLYGVSETVAPWFTMRALVGAYLLAGMTFTSENKDGSIYDHKPIEQCGFLKRGFRKQGPYWVGPLAQDSINECLNWVKKGANTIIDLQKIAEGCIAEWSLHEKKVFEFWRDRISLVLMQRIGAYVLCFEHEKYMQELFYGKFSESFPQLCWA